MSRICFLYKNLLFISALVSFSLFTGFGIGTVHATGYKSNEIPRPEHPKPQFYRDRWINLNGEWNFAFDFGVSGIEKGWHKDPSQLDKKIVVPFCPESKLSGINYTDFIPAVWYHRTVKIPENWNGSRVFLNFGAVDYDCRVWMNGTLVGRHYGGSASFSFEITNQLTRENNDIVVFVTDDIRSGNQPSGKQSNQLEHYSCFYTRTTGIWQTVWLESRPNAYIESVKIIPDLDNSRFVLTPVIENYTKDMIFKATLMTNKGKEINSFMSSSANGIPLFMDIDNPKPWSPENPFLYKLKFELIKGNKVVDKVKSYAGLRKFHIEGNKFYLNNKPIFLRLILDQGFYPDGIWTAPTDNELKADILRAMNIGFNGARLHEKVFEERFHYLADSLGYLTWGEFYDWEIKSENHLGMNNLMREWYEVVKRDLNHPSIIAWTPYNERAETNVESNRRVVQETVDVTRAIDPTRPVNDASGYVHVDTDIFTVHDYDQNPKTFAERYDSLSVAKNCAFICHPELSVPYTGQPYVVDEYGGTHWSIAFSKQKPDPGDRVWEWGKGKQAEVIENLIEKLTKILLENPNVSGFCYTQLTDVEQEINGIYTYDRKLKYNATRLKKIFGAPAAVEEK